MTDGLISKGKRVLNEKGILDFLIISARYTNITLQQKYRRSSIRRQLPRTEKFLTCNDVRVEHKRLFDGLFSHISNDPDYERQYTEYIQEYVETGDSVVVIGGYYGVSTVAAANRVGKSGSVKTFEASEDGTARVRRTATLNGVEDRLTVETAIIGPVYNLKGQKPGSKRLSPAALPDCDVLAIDCDGCELAVLAKLESEPRIIIVEHHGESPTPDGLEFEYQRDTLERRLTTKGYTIIDEHSQPLTVGEFEDRIGWFVAKQDDSE